VDSLCDRVELVGAGMIVVEGVVSGGGGGWGRRGGVRGGGGMWVGKGVSPCPRGRCVRKAGMSGFEGAGSTSGCVRVR